MFLEHKAIPIGYSGRISSLPTIFLSESGERNKRHQNSSRIPVGKSGGYADKNTVESKVNTLSFFVCSFKDNLRYCKGPSKKKTKVKFLLECAIYFTHVTYKI